MLRTEDPVKSLVVLTKNLLLDLQHLIMDSINNLFHLHPILLVLAPAGALARQRLEIRFKLVQPLQVASDL